MSRHGPAAPSFTEAPWGTRIGRCACAPVVTNASSRPKRSTALTQFSGLALELGFGYLLGIKGSGNSRLIKVQVIMAVSFAHHGRRPNEGERRTRFNRRTRLTLNAARRVAGPTRLTRTNSTTTAAGGSRCRSSTGFRRTTTLTTAPSDRTRGRPC